jgi:predicted metal-dependent hydrolase
MAAVNHLILGYVLEKEFISLCKIMAKDKNNGLDELIKKLYEYNYHEINNNRIIFEVIHKNMKCCYEDEEEDEIPDTISINDEDYLKNNRKEELKEIIINIEGILKNNIKNIPFKENIKWGVFSYVKKIDYD